MKTLLNSTAKATKTLVIRTTIVSAGLLLCVWLGLTVLGPMIPALLIFILGFTLKLRLEWRVPELLMGLLPSEMLMLIIIATNNTGRGGQWVLDPVKLVDPFNLEWLLGLNLLLGLPWVTGIAVASVVSLRRRKKRTNTPA
jgi:hypothetical protein